MLLDKSITSKPKKDVKRFSGLSTASVGKWQEYAYRKQAWIDKNGFTDQAAYDAMIIRLSNELGI